ncbi:SMI1/KNR4 family protein [Streptomyces sp. NPDC059452]|uniref:SMI1/KNR4 family protein n=1 Tax=Streptomyces sp. NPDC059452 TaxID=3346835 RepID=UPI003685E60C
MPATACLPGLPGLTCLPWQRLSASTVFTLPRMTIDWIAESRRLDRGHRSDERGRRPSRRGAPPPPLSEREVREAEAELGIVFPDQYREYVLRKSAGGAVNRLRRSAAGWGWEGDADTNYDLLTTPFPHPDSYRGDEDDLDAREPLAENFPDHSAHQAAWKQWEAEYEVFEEHKTAGAVVIQENGCGFSTLLAVTGPLRGSLWFDARATCDLILPLLLGGRPVSFTDWLARGSMELVRW